MRWISSNWYRTVVIFLVTLAVLLLATSGHAQNKTVVLMFSEGQQPQVAKVPAYAYCGMQPLSKDDKILDAAEFEAKGKNIYFKAIEFYRKAYRSKNWNPAKMRMLVIQKNENKAFSMSGNVSANFSNSVNDTASLTHPGATLGKNTSDTLSSSGGIFPSYSKSWTDQKFEVWFFLVE